MNKSVQFSLTYWAAEHPAVTRFRWDHSAWGSTWTFVAVSLFTYLVFLAICRAIAAILKKGISLGKFASAYSVALALIRCLILLGCVEATLAETKDMWRLWARLRRLQNTSRLRAGIEWAICFPLGTRSAGPVFFWSYVFYLTTYLELAETLISVVRKERVAASDVLHKITAVVACFCWLEFTQSMQILGMAVHTLNTVFRMGNLRGICDGCKTVTLVMASVWLLCLHFRRGGCNGLESWALGTFGYVVSGCLRFTNKQKERTS